MQNLASLVASYMLTWLFCHKGARFNRHEGNASLEVFFCYIMVTILSIFTVCAKTQPWCAELCRRECSIPLHALGGKQVAPWEDDDRQPQSWWRKPTEMQGHADSTHKGGRSGRTRLFLLCCVRDWDLTKCTALATAQWLHMPSNKISYATLSVTTISYCTAPITGGLLWLLYLSYIRVNTPLTDVMVTTPQVRADGRNQLEDQ